MISLKDCIAFSCLDENEVAAIGEHEHIPDIAATALANDQALDAGHVRHAAKLFMALRHFLDQNREARVGSNA